MPALVVCTCIEAAIGKRDAKLFVAGAMLGHSVYDKHSAVRASVPQITGSVVILAVALPTR
jgi:hypothetical protein